MEMVTGGEKVHATFSALFSCIWWWERVLSSAYIDWVWLKMAVLGQCVAMFKATAVPLATLA